MLVHVFGRGVPVSLQEVADRLFGTTRGQGSKSRAANAITVNIRNKQRLPVPRSDDDNLITPSSSAHKRSSAQRPTRLHHPIAIPDQRQTPNIGHVFHINLLMLITIMHDQTSIKDSKTIRTAQELYM